jgi:UDP-2,4-diacetamido-2,4,6-trideoxy-beta-L-altropyranose hydrolase
MASRVAFRVDASLKIGTGHVMRCLTLATELSLDGFDCFFICQNLPGNLINEIQRAGFFVEVLFLASDPMSLGNDPVTPIAHFEHSWRQDAAETLSKLDGSIDWLILDHYYLDDRWERIVYKKCKHLMVIDDLANRRHFCDLLLDQNLGRLERDYQELIPDSAQLLFGPAYALLRPVFSRLREGSIAFRKQKNRIHRLIISMGGIDLDNYTLKVLEELKNCRLPPEFEIDVIMGANAPWTNSVQSFANKMPWKTQVLVGVPNMAELMAKADFAIGAAGSTSWERCCLGLPTFLCVLADNQFLVAEKLTALGAARQIDWVTESENRLCSLMEWASDANNLSNLSKRSMELCDGLGVYRIINEIKTYQ